MVPDARRWFLRTARALALAGPLAWAQPQPELVPVPELGLRIQRGFRVSVYADADLANDIYALTLDPHGQVVVTSAGYIKRLLDTDGDGRADDFDLFATPAGGGMGMYFDGPMLFFSGDGWFSRYEDLDDDGVADQPPERLFPLGAGEHGGHAIRKGPDGCLYLIGGNNTGFDARHITLPGSPVSDPEAGALLRLTPDGRGAQIIAHGFRNPYSFDFGVAGDIFTYDSDVEADYFLPWYSPTRLYHVAYGGHHGWRLDGWKRSWARPPYYPDTVDVLADLDRGSPCGVICYRHRQFPARYRGGLFLLDWTFGRIFFVPVEPDGASYQAQPELFLEPIGTHGFAPTDLAVSTNGSLFVSIGGRKTRGAVFRIDYAGPPLLDPVRPATPIPALNAVLEAPQPLDAWSRAQWVPAAQELGPGPFARLLVEETVDPVWRARAVEILTEAFNGLPQAAAQAASLSPSPLLRARVAWSLGREPGPNPALVLFPLLADEHPLVRRCALEAVADHLEDLESPELVRRLLPNLGHQDKRVRLAAARVARRLSATAWDDLSAHLASADPGTCLTGLMAQMWRSAEAAHLDALAPLAGLLAEVRDAELRLDTIRLVMLALGDWRLHEPSVELYTGYETAVPPPAQNASLDRIRATVRSFLPSEDALLNVEAARLLAMLQDSDPRVARVLLGFITPRSDPTADFHFLTCFSRLRVWPADLTPKVADALLNLDRKLEGRTARPKQNWSVRLTELVTALHRREPKLVPALLSHPAFATPEHLGLAVHLGPEHQAAVARLYLRAVQRNTNFPWSAQLVELLGTLSPPEVKLLLRAQWNNLLLRDDILRHLTHAPETADRERFWEGLGSERLDVVQACAAALLELPREPGRTNLLAPLKLLRRLLDQPREVALRARALALLSAQTGRTFAVQEPPVPEKPSLVHAATLKTAYQPVFAWVATNHPRVFQALETDSPDDPVTWRQRLRSVPWAQGDSRRGERLFVERGCAACHAGARPLGPDLSGVTGRFSVEDLFNAIVFPSQDIAEAYRPTRFVLRDGGTVNGLVAFESADGVIVQTSATVTERLAEADIRSREPSEVSFMPSGLLAGLSPRDLADLYSFLKTLQPPR